MENRFQCAHEIAKIYHAMTDRETLTTYFLDSLKELLETDRAVLFLAGGGKEERIWLEKGDEGVSGVVLKAAEAEAKLIQTSGKVAVWGSRLWIPLIARNRCLGVVGTWRTNDESFHQEDEQLGISIATEFANALKSILLYEENIKMERLAAMGQTIGMVVHEIKNILNLATLADEMLHLGIKENKQKFVDSGLSKIGKALKEMDGFIWEMLSLTKDQAIETQMISIAELFKELEEDLQNKTKAASAELVIDVPSDFPEVAADKRSLYRAILNLVKNAYEAKKEDTICVRLSAKIVDDNSYQISVSDNGSGMPDEARAKLFQAFFTTKGKHGTGLGLMVVERAVAMHRGKINVESQLGKGTNFIFTLPRAQTKD